MVKQVSYLPILFALFLGGFSVAVAQATTSIHHENPHLLTSFAIKPKQTTGAAASACSYLVTMKTSCSSPTFTRDEVNLIFGDSSGNEVFAERLDDPSSWLFERCATDTFKIKGNCAYNICYLYLLREGSDGWKPESVQVYGPDGRCHTFNFNIFLPNGVWYGFNHCLGASGKAEAVVVH